MEELHSVCDSLGIDRDAVDTAYGDIVKANLRRGRRAASVNAAAAYIAARRTLIPVTLGSIAKALGTPVRDARRIAMQAAGGSMPAADPEAFMRVGAERLGMEIDVYAMGRVRDDIAAPVRAAVALFLSAGGTVSADDIAAAIGIESSTLKSYVHPGGELKVKALPR